MKNLSSVILLIFSLLGFVPAISLFAGEVYKYIDEYGNVYYSSEQPDSNQEAEQLIAPPEPSEEDIAAAQEELLRLEAELANQTRASNRDQSQSQRSGQTPKNENSSVNPALVTPKQPSTTSMPSAF